MSRSHGTGYIEPAFIHRGTYREFGHDDAAALRNVDVSLLHLCGPVRDQGPVNACLPHALASAEELWARRAGLPHDPVSAIALYATALHDSGRRADTGLTTAEALAAAASGGLVSASAWDDDPELWRETLPDDFRARAAAERRVLHTMPLPPSAPDIRWALMAGQSVIAGLRLFESSVDAAAQGGTLAMPREGERPYTGHAVLIVGYSTARRAYLSQWAWGRGFGQGGFVDIPEEYLQDPLLTPELHAILGFRRIAPEPVENASG